LDYAQPALDPGSVEARTARAACTRSSTWGDVVWRRWGFDGEPPPVAEMSRLALATV
jgi:hypothetical protein